MKIHSGNNRRRVVCLAASALCLLVSAARADSAYTLAESKAHKLHVFADGGSAWCGEHLALRMVLDPDSPDAANTSALVDVMNRLKSPISTDCKAAVSADLALIDEGKTVGTYRAAANGGWIFTAVSAPSSSPTAEAAPTSRAGTPSTSTPTVTASEPPPAPKVAAPVAPAAPALQIGNDYVGILIRLLHDNPALALEDATIRWWAAYRFPREYQQFQNQEFKLLPILDKARVDLAEVMAHADPDRVILNVATPFQSYDFASQRFPLILNLEALQVSTQWWGIQSNFPSVFTMKVSGLDAITGLPMTPDAARSFIERRTQFTWVNRSINVAVTVKLDPTGIQKDNWRNQTATGAAESVVFYGDREGKDVLYRVGETEIATMRAEKEAVRAAAVKAEQERQAAIQRQQLLAQRDQSIRILASSPLSTRLANFISPEPINLNARLANLRDARASALIRGQAVEVSMLVQADGSGRENIATKWPGKLRVTSTEGQPEMKSSGWYLVRGLLSASEDDLPFSALLLAQSVYVCTQPQCADAADAAFIIDRKLADAPQPH